MWVSFYGISERGDSGERKFYQHKCPFVGVVCYFCISTSSAEYRWFTYFSCITFVHQYFGLHLVQYFSWKKRKILSFQQGIEIPWSVTKEYFVLHCQQFLIGRRGIVQKEMHRKGGLWTYKNTFLVQMQILSILRIDFVSKYVEQFDGLQEQLF